MTYTPGPWIAQRKQPDRKSIDPWRIISTHPSVGCAGCHICDVDGESDAMLIAAAPALLEACEIAMEACRMNLVMFQFKDEKALHAAFKACESAIAETAAMRSDTSKEES